MSYNFSFEGLSGAEAVKVLKKKAREIENLEISHQLITLSDKSKGANLLCDKPGECVDRNCDKQGNCEIKGCEIRFCACKEYMYENNVLPNRRDLSNPHCFQKTLKCGSDKNGVKRGIYTIICIKDDCNCKGVIYIGCTGDIMNRIRKHTNVIDCLTQFKVLRVHRHFQENNHDLSHFRYAILEEVKYDSLKPKEILVRENHFMDKFGTFKSWFGCNDKRNRVEEDDDASTSEPSAKKSKLSLGSFGHPKGTTHKDKDHSIEKWCIALALRNLKDEKGTTSQITQFSRTHYKDDYDLSGSRLNPNGTAIRFLRSSVNPSYIDHASAKTMLENWFVWVNEEEQKKKEKNDKHQMEYVFGLNTGILESINDELLMEYESGSFDNFMKDAADLYYMQM